MADPTLARGATNFNTSGSLTLTLYNAQTETLRKSANLIDLPLPGQDSGNAVLYDILGTTREFIIRGEFTTADNADIWKFATDLNSLMDGAQGDTGAAQVGYTYTPRILNDGVTPPSTVTVRVYVNDVNVDWKAGEPNSLEYTIILKEAASTSA